MNDLHPVELPEPAELLDPADLVAAAVLAVPFVAGLHGGRFGEVATYLPGRRITGVRLGAGTLDLHVTARYPATVEQIDVSVRAAVSALLPTPTVVSIVVEDVVEPGDGPAIRSAPAIQENS